MLYDRQTLWTRPFSVEVRSHVYFHVHKGNVRHVTARKLRGDFFIQLYGRSVLIAPSNGTVAQRLCDVQYWENIQHVL